MPPERELRILGESVLGKDILEIACGGGQSAVHLATMGARVTAVDFSKAQLEHARAFARSKNASVRFLEADVQDLSMLDHGSFEIAFSWMSPFFAMTEERGLLVKRSYFDRSPILFEEKDGTEVDFHRTYGDWHRALTDAGFIVTDILEPEPLPRENTYADVFPLSKIRMIPGTTIWRALKPAPSDAMEERREAHGWR